MNFVNHYTTCILDQRHSGTGRRGMVSAIGNKPIDMYDEDSSLLATKQKYSHLVIQLTIIVQYACTTGLLQLMHAHALHSV